MAIVQIFCTIQDLIADKQDAGIVESVMFQKIREASDYLQKEIGWFLPVTLTRRFNGRGNNKLIIPPVLAITSLINDGVTIDAEDYIVKPDDGFWPYGPYGWLIVDPDATDLLDWVEDEDGVEITGRWGLYERSALIGASVQDTTQQSDSQLTLKVSDGGKVSPGMVLKIESEQQLVTGWGSPTTGVTTLAANVDAADDETITVADGSLINVGEIIRTTFEQMRVNDKQTNLLDVTRGWNGTRRVNHTSGAAVDVYRTVSVERGLNGTASAAHTNGTAISRYFAPDDVQFLCKEIATLMANKAGGGYQGRTGNEQTGVISYYDAFPRFDIERVKDNYRIPVAR
jgi:hypothetical protein